MEGGWPLARRVMQQAPGGVRSARSWQPSYTHRMDGPVPAAQQWRDKQGNLQAGPSNE